MGIIPAKGGSTQRELEVGHSYAGRITPLIIFSGFIGSMLHIIGGYDSGITGGVFGMKPFLEKFYPELLDGTAAARTPYCKFANNTLNLYTAVFYPFIVLGAFGSAYLSRHHGRLWSLRAAAAVSIVGSLTQVFAQNRAAILAGRMVLGLGDGFNEHVSAIYLAEIAPPNHRGRFISGTIFFGGFGVLVAQLVNYGVRDREDGWRIALGMICVPCGCLLLGSLIMPESPVVLASLGKKSKAERSLRRLRGTEDVAVELRDVTAAASGAPTLKRAVKLLLTKKEYWPSTAVVLLGVTFNWWSGNSAATFYAPNIFTILGFGSKTSLMNAVVIGCSKIAGVFLGLVMLDMFPRRAVLMVGAVFMVASQSTSAALFGAFLKDEPGAVATNTQGVAILITMVAYEVAFMATQNTTVTVLMGELPPLEIRPVVWVLLVIFTATWGLTSTYSFLLMLCAMKWGLYAFSAGIALLLFFYAYFLVPESSGVPVERLRAIFYDHWLWKRFMPEDRDAWRTYLDGYSGRPIDSSDASDEDTAGNVYGDSSDSRRDASDPALDSKVGKASLSSDDGSTPTDASASAAAPGTLASPPSAAGLIHRGGAGPAPGRDPELARGRDEEERIRVQNLLLRASRDVARANIAP